jgi:hypothetical protein
MLPINDRIMGSRDIQDALNGMSNKRFFTRIDTTGHRFIDVGALTELRNYVSTIDTV